MTALSLPQIYEAISRNGEAWLNAHASRHHGRKAKLEMEYKELERTSRKLERKERKAAKRGRSNT